jgi:hypothetical protein
VVSERQLAGNLDDVALAAREGCELRPSVIEVADFDEALAAANGTVLPCPRASAPGR